VTAGQTLIGRTYAAAHHLAGERRPAPARSADRRCKDRHAIALRTAARNPPRRIASDAFGVSYRGDTELLNYPCHRPIQNSGE